MLLTLKDLFLNHDDPTFPYIENLRIIENLHFGQLKLFIGTLFFLANYVKGKNPKIVIPGGGSGDGAINNMLLAELFPNYEFHLIDPLGFPTKKPKNVTTYEDYFTDEMAIEWSTKKNVYLVSDIRTTPEGYEPVPQSGPHVEMEEHVDYNMRQQEKWHQIIKPEYSHFKFRFPFTSDRWYTYLDGRIMKQCFAGQKSHETRLIVAKDAKQIKYDTKLYEGQMSYHNLVMRRRQYENTFITKTGKYLLAPELNGDFDSTYFILVLQTFLGNDMAKIESFAKMVLDKLTKGRSLQQRRKASLDFEVKNKDINKNRFTSYNSK